MPLYQYSVHNSDRFEADDDVSLPDDLSARARAIEIVHELQKADEANWREFTMEVRRDGQLVWEIPFEVSRPAA
jgi:hypothetical protein